jgi:hypothetical protein
MRRRDLPHGCGRISEPGPADPRADCTDNHPTLPLHPPPSRRICCRLALSSKYVRPHVEFHNVHALFRVFHGTFTASSMLWRRALGPRPYFQARGNVTAISTLSSQKRILACNPFPCPDQRIVCSVNGLRRGPRLTRVNRKGDDERV